ncbi:doxX family protein [Paraburkholderia xenovorans LB400]|uniref:DoxX family protein n=1 Tax=Paraburkholderia xenovorans TaxID=36873 RepID=UPI00003C4568|nr:DoxX family protein [Paraburkholderia xenovorans]AIP33913.1 doxX family protein [Paraburkholderia xenovorans LB400]
MSSSARQNPRWVDAILVQPWLLPLVRMALVSAYVIGGLAKLANFHAAVLEQEHFGLHPGWLWAVFAIVVELGGSVCVIADRLVWLGAGGLGVLTMVAMFVANDFWNQLGSARFMALNSFFEHLGLLAALVMATCVAGVKQSAGTAGVQKNP